MATKKKYSQHDLRRLMNEQKAAKLNTTKQVEKPKINSPLAKYNELNQLTCILCKTVVRSEAVWSVHINANQHKQNIQLAKELKDRAEQAQALKQAVLKRAATSTVDSAPPAKVLKSILKKTDTETEPAKVTSVKRVAETPATATSSQQPSTSKATPATDKQEETPSDETLPEGFFDDPHLDAKARNIEYKDPNEEEWERFVKEIKNVTDVSTNIINEEQETATVERQIDEIDEQIRNWSR
jgi:zinc finger protein 830